uniref:Interferon regulatory factor 7 n=1 Tax=Neogobius melanostomus TaxID=47308 RepID=A0A8C6T418_9GOBI
MQSLPKPQFAHWLIEQLETGQYKGLSYVGHGKFRVPWKHNSRKDCNDEDGKIFKAWAVASGKINDFPNDKARWKTNFRCALNNLRGRFRKIEDNSKSDDPHKVYEIINPGSKSCVSRNLSLDQCKPLHYVNDYIIPQSSPAVAETYPIVSAPGNNTEQHSYNGHPAQFNPQQPSMNDLEISIFYRRREMFKTVVLNCPQLQLHYPQETQGIQSAICFPSTEDLIDHKQIHYTNRILDSIQRGLTLEVQQSGIFAYRQGSCHVFASTSDAMVAQPNPQKLPLNTPVQLLSFENYLHELRMFKENNGHSPEYTINMCFGEKFPDGRALERKLIVVKVVPLICRYFHEQAQVDGASSLHSSDVSLQTSHNSLMELITSAFGLPTMEEQPVQY